MTEERENTHSIYGEKNSLQRRYSDTFLYILMPWLWERQKCLYEITASQSVTYFPFRKKL